MLDYTPGTRQQKRISQTLSDAYMTELVFELLIVFFPVCSHVKAKFSTSRLKSLIKLTLELTKSKKELAFLRTGVYRYQTSLSWTEEQFVETMIARKADLMTVKLRREKSRSAASIGTKV